MLRISSRTLILYGGAGLFATSILIVSFMTLAFNPQFHPAWLASFTFPLQPPPDNPNQNFSNYYPSDSLSPNLQDRIQSLLHAPVLSSVEAMPANELSCPVGVVNHHMSLGALWRHFWVWGGVGKHEIVRRRMDIVKHLEGVALNDLVSPPKFKGRGIVMTGGNKVRPSMLSLALKPFR